ncbi:putative 2-hydroxyacid dehydrogenase YoaD [Enterococcus avium]|uniref:NAD(P)-dependent oxidoreductase n=1 Tax=Enterococcus devriesei TaxID=319970 RepID=UPI001599C097|nr:NAD(P)-dependent oxidoreductase [Enterococcus devriesei]BBM18426.1 putative 2-hydroxyacid dehydrogenase YoaD [Enterococcus avium]
MVEKLLVRAPMNEESLEKLGQLFEIEYWPWDETGERLYEDELLEVLLEKKPDAIITELDQVTEKVLSGYTDLKFIGDCRATPENIDIAACNAHNIPVICTPARNANAVAEMWLGALIAFERNLVDSVNWIEDKKWIKGTTPYYTWMGKEIYKSKIGFVGFGAVAQHIVKLLQGFNVEICYYDPFVNTEDYQKVELDELFATSDYVSIHLPVNEVTKNMVNSNLMSKMKEDAVFINSSRSAVVENDVLYQLLDEKKIRGAILDVLDTEPPEGSDLHVIEMKNVLLTPHTYGASYQVVDHQSEIVTNNIINFLNKENLAKSIYNYKAIGDKL